MGQRDTRFDVAVTQAFRTAFADLRAERGISQRELARRAGFARTYIVKLESGRHVPSLGNLYRLAGGLDMPVHVLIKRVSRKLAVLVEEPNPSQKAKDAPQVVQDAA